MCSIISVHVWMALLMGSRLLHAATVAASNPPPLVCRPQVVQVKTDEREGYTALQLGAGAKRPKQLRGSLRGHFEAAGEHRAPWCMQPAPTVQSRGASAMFSVLQAASSAALAACAALQPPLPRHLRFETFMFFFCPRPGVPLKRKVAEFRVTPDALLPVGHELRASHFVAGQFVDVSGTSIGKGFQVRCGAAGPEGACSCCSG